MSLKFIDLFAGLGGFHKALSSLGHSCVFASEINSELCDLYKKNWGIEPYGDIRDIVENNLDIIPEHDILCAGFPCQPFSKAGKQEGLKDIDRGTLFDEIVKIVSARKPQYLLLENVPFIAKHNNAETWGYIKKELEAIGYQIDSEIYSPHQFGIPQTRKRLFIVGKRKSLGNFNFSQVTQNFIESNDAKGFCEDPNNRHKKLRDDQLEILDTWQAFLQAIPKHIDVPGFPIWSMEFGATYPYEKTQPSRMSYKDLKSYKGSFGINIEGDNREEINKFLPSYSIRDTLFQKWKMRWIKDNRSFYDANKFYLADSVKKIKNLKVQSHQKLECNSGRKSRNIYDHILQFRPSGIRMKNTKTFPSLVCNTTQIPIIGWQRRYLSIDEGLRLQALDGITMPESSPSSFRAIGNAVNAKIVENIASILIS